jgi:hypothetical protein
MCPPCVESATMSSSSPPSYVIGPCRGRWRERVHRQTTTPRSNDSSPESPLNELLEGSRMHCIREAAVSAGPPKGAKHPMSSRPNGSPDSDLRRERLRGRAAAIEVVAPMRPTAMHRGRIASGQAANVLACVTIGGTQWPITTPTQ